MASLHRAKSILVDSHAHIHDCFNLDDFFDQADRNLSSAARALGKSDSFVGVLMLAETAAEHYFSRFAAIADSPNTSDPGKHVGNWSFHKTEEPCSLLATKDAALLVLIAGRQVATSEHLEVLILGTEETFQDGLPIDSILELARSRDAIQVIPWGTGKWLFKRGRILAKLIDARSTNGFYLGDQGGRPVFWPTPRHFKRGWEKGIRILPGSDPLPFPSEIKRPGSFGFLMDVSLDPLRPAASIKAHLRNPRIKLSPFGRLQGPSLFLYNQVGMQFLKRRPSRAAAHI